MAEWVRVASIEDIPEGTGKELVAGDRIVAVFHAGGAFSALDGICPHSGGPLGKGRVEGCIVTCPWHGWQFDVTTGRHCLNNKLTQPGFAVKVDGRDIWVEIP